MKAAEFVGKLAEVTPSQESLLGAGRSIKFAERFAASGKLTPRKSPLGIASIIGSDDLIDLFNRWDPSQVIVGMIEFFDRPVDTPRGLQIGVEEAEPLLVSQDSGEIVVEEAAAPGHRLGDVAESGNKLLDALIVAAKFFGARAMKTIAYDDFATAKAAAADCAAAAGGERFLQFYLTLLGAEE